MKFQVGDRVQDLYGNIGKIVKVYDDFSAIDKEFTTITGRMWLSVQKIKFTKSQYYELCYSMETYYGRKFISCESRLRKLINDK